MINLPAVFVANGAGVTMLLLLLSCSRPHRNMTPSESLFYHMVFLTIAQCVIETLTFVLDGKTFAGAYLLLVVTNSVTYILNILFAYLWTSYVDYQLFEDWNATRLRRCLLGIPAGVIVLLAVLNLFTPVFFTISADNVYHRTGLYLLPYVCTYCYLLYAVIRVYLNRKQVQHYLLGPILIFMLPLLIGSLLQYTFYGLSLIWLGTSIAIVTLYINVQNAASAIDPLTGLFSRQYLNAYLSGKAGREGATAVMGLLADVDEFKAINDQCGHTVGDELLREVARLLSDVADPGDVLVRYTGDEFVLLRQTNDPAELFALCDRVRTAVDNLNGTATKPYHLSLSIGTGSMKGRHDTPDAFLRRMDVAMYAEKDQKKSRKI